MKKVSLRSFPSVQLAVHGLGQYRVINTVEEAAETLLDRWPEDEYGQAFEQALETCVKAMNDQAAPEAVRAALIKAAEEAEIGVRD
jgi:adenosine/AMP kinase